MQHAAALAGETKAHKESWLYGSPCTLTEAMESAHRSAAARAPMTIAASAEQLKRSLWIACTMPVLFVVSRSAWLERATPSCTAHLLLPSPQLALMS